MSSARKVPTRRAVRAVGAVFTVLLMNAAGDASAQCALCRDALDAAGPQTRTAMNFAIAGLAIAPYAVAGLAALALSPSLRNRLRGFTHRAFGRPASRP